ncbi:MAG: hypothetical protein WC775_03395 [Patescibacteria group bacterium]
MNKHLYLYPIIIFVFLINYHFYSFYEKNFLSVRALVQQSGETDKYKAVQQEHPYYEIWQLSRQQDLRVIFIMDRRDDTTFDYTTTYYEKQSGSKDNFYLSELGLYINYYFFPRIIPARTVQEAMGGSVQYAPGDVVVSDVDLSLYDVDKLRKPGSVMQIPTLEIMEQREKSFVDVIRKPTIKYFIYKVISPAAYAR